MITSVLRPCTEKGSEVTLRLKIGMGVDEASTFNKTIPEIRNLPACRVYLERKPDEIFWPI